MMPIFFPFTFIPPETVDLLQTCFSRMAVLQPVPGRLPEEMERLQAAGWLDVRAPLDIDVSRLEETIRGIRTWADLNRGSRGLDTGFAHSTGSRLPLFDETAPSRIRDAIRSQGGTAPRSRSVPPPLLTDLVFLSMAEQFDIQNRSLSEDFNDLKQMEAELFDKLQGGNDAIQRPSARQPIQQQTESENYMLAERLAAWRRAMGASFASGEMPAVAVTASRPVVEDLIDASGVLREAVCMENIPVCDPAAPETWREWRLELGAYLQKLASGEDPLRTCAPGSPAGVPADPLRLFCVHVYVASGVDLWHLLDPKGSEVPDRRSAEDEAHSVLVLVQG